jgi:hypothetical protein
MLQLQLCGFMYQLYYIQVQSGKTGGLHAENDSFAAGTAVMASATSFWLPFLYTITFHYLITHLLGLVQEGAT